MQAGKWRDALTRLNWAEHLDPQMTTATVLRGICLSRLGRWHDAIGPLSKAIAINPQDARALANLAAAYYETSQPEAARTHAERLGKLSVYACHRDFQDDVQAQLSRTQRTDLRQAGRIAAAQFASR